MTADIVIRGGIVVDGTGAPGRAADVAIADGVITAIGPELHGDRELDASGCVVAPGFIDIHTHYDAQVFWDPALRPSSYHGVTTVVAGNCGFTIAPTRPEHHETIVQHARERRGHGPGNPHGGCRVGLRDVPRVPRCGAAPRHRPELHGVHRSLGAAALRARRCRVRTGRDIGGDRPHVRARTRGHRGRRGRLLDELLVRAPRRRRQAGPEPVRRRATRSMRCFERPTRPARVSCCITPGEQCTYADVYDWAARIGASDHVSVVRDAERQAPRTSSCCTTTVWHAARGCGRRSRPGR